jgi:hypothetical protein
LRVDEGFVGLSGERLAGEGQGVARVANPEDARVGGFEIVVTGEDGTGAGLESPFEGDVILREDDGVRSGVAECGDSVELGGGVFGGRGADEGAEVGEGEAVQVAWFQGQSLRG